MTLLPVRPEKSLKKSNTLRARGAPKTKVASFLLSPYGLPNPPGRPPPAARACHRSTAAARRLRKHGSRPPPGAAARTRPFPAVHYHLLWATARPIPFPKRQSQISQHNQTVGLWKWKTFLPPERKWIKYIYRESKFIENIAVYQGDAWAVAARCYWACPGIEPSSPIDMNLNTKHIPHNQKNTLKNNTFWQATTNQKNIKENKKYTNYTTHAYVDLIFFKTAFDYFE